jgi:integrase/recombinase XerD
MEELLEVLEAAKSHRERDWVLCLVSFWHGLRASEAVSLTPEHFVDGYLIVQRLKGSRKTVQKLAEHPAALLNEKAAVESWIQKHQGLHDGKGERERLFPISRKQYWNLMQLYCRRAGVPEQKARPHVFKHTLASLTIERMGIHKVQQLLGHKSGASTMKYLDTTDAEAMREAVAAVQSQSFYRPMSLAFGEDAPGTLKDGTK